MFVNLTGKDVYAMSDDRLLLSIQRGQYELKLHTDAELDGSLSENGPCSLLFLPRTELRRFEGERIIVSRAVAMFIRENELRTEVYYVDDTAPDEHGDFVAKGIRLLQRCC